MTALIRLAALALLSAVAHGLTITTPAAGDIWTLAGTNTITWTSLATDPATLSVQVVNTATAATNTLGATLNTADGTFTVNGATDLAADPVGTTYQINLLDSTTGNILATSGTFSISADGTAVTPSSASSSSAVPTTASTSSPVSSSASLTSMSSSSTTSTSSSTGGITSASLAPNVFSAAVGGPRLNGWLVSGALVGATAALVGSWSVVML